MAKLNLFSLLILLLSTLCISTCGGSSSSDSRKVLNLDTRKDDSIYPSPTTLPSSTPITNPANFPPYTPTPTIVTVPASNPTSFTPVNPIATPTTTVPTSTTPTTTVPITNPAAPLTNPTTTYPTPTTTTPGSNVPGINPPTQTSSAPITPGQTWCIARSGLPDSSLQPGLDYACGIGGADCSTIQQGASCYNPNTMENHASYAFNSYFQKNPVPTSCDFGGTAVLVNTNPSTGSCIYPSSATGTASGTPSSTYPPATTSSTNGAGSPYGVAGSPYEVPGTGYGSPPSLFNLSNPTGFPVSYGPDSPPTGNTLPAGSTNLQPCIGFIILMAAISTGKLVFSS